MKVDDGTRKKSLQLVSAAEAVGIMYVHQVHGQRTY